MIKGTKAVVTEVGTCHFFIPGEIITFTGETGNWGGVDFFVFEGQARDYPYEQGITQSLEAEDFEVIQ